MNIVTQFATTEAVKNDDVLSALGIDIPTLIFQGIAFLILVFALSKWVYPVLIGIVDKRQADIDAGTKAADEAKLAASDAENEVAKLLQQARAEASDIVTTAKEEASALVNEAESRAKTKSEAIVAAAQEQLDKDVLAAKKVLHNETIDLVALATEKVIGSVLSKNIDKSVIASTLKGVK